MDEKKIIVLAQKGDNGAIDELFARYKKLVVSRARKYYLVGGDIDDLIQEGMVGFLKAINTFDEKKGEFSAYAKRLINNEILNLIKKSNAKKQTIFNEHLELNNQGEIVVDETISVGVSDNISPESEFLRQENYEGLLEEIHSHLSDWENSVLNLYLEGYTHTEIQKTLNTTYKSIDNALTRIKNKLKSLR